MEFPPQKSNRQELIHKTKDKDQVRAIRFQQSQVTQSVFSFKTDRNQGLSEPARVLFKRNQLTKHTIPSSSQRQPCSSALTSRGTNTESDREPCLEGEVAWDPNAQSKGWRTVAQREIARANPVLVTGCAPSNHLLTALQQFSFLDSPHSQTRLPLPTLLRLLYSTLAMFLMTF